MPPFGDPEIHIDEACPSVERFEATSVFPLIHALKDDIETNIDASLSWDQLNASDVTFTITRPLVFKNFLRLSQQNLAHAGLNNSRAMMCELMAMKLLRHFADNNFELVAVLSHTWNPLAGAPHQVVESVKAVVGGEDIDLNEPKSALEMAIMTKSKTFLASPLVQTTITKYDRLKFMIIAALLSWIRIGMGLVAHKFFNLNVIQAAVFFVLCIINSDLERVTTFEAIFGIFVLAFALEEYTASYEHGWNVYIEDMWNVFDTSFIVVWLVYLVFRVRGLAYHDNWSNDLAFDVLSCGACILFPRLAFFAVSNSVFILSLRAMIADFFYFITIAVICFSGLLFTLWELPRLEPNNKWTVGSIAWLMTQIWFGNTDTSFDEAASFHPIFGPILMVVFAALSNTLLITILISILTNTFARIDANATEEHLFQFAVTTLEEGVNSDVLFCYQPPFNLLAYAILAPMSCFVSPRTLHLTNMFLNRITSFPFLLVIAIYERYLANIRRESSDAARSFFKSLPRSVKNVTFIEAFVGSSSNTLYEALFEVEVPPMDVFEELEDESENGSFHRTLEPPPRQDHLYGITASPKPLGVPESPGTGGRMSRSPSRQRAPLEHSPLARVYARHPATSEGEGMEGVVEGLNRLEHALDGMPRIREEMKELQERQARIENLLLTLTRGLRGESNISRNGTR